MQSERRRMLARRLERGGYVAASAYKQAKRANTRRKRRGAQAATQSTISPRFIGPCGPDEDKATCRTRASTFHLARSLSSKCCSEPLSLASAPRPFDAQSRQSPHRLELLEPPWPAGLLLLSLAVVRGTSTSTRARPSGGMTSANRGPFTTLKRLAPQRYQLPQAPLRQHTHPHIPARILHLQHHVWK